MAMIGGAGSAYVAGAVGGAGSAPKEIGFLTRVEGLRSGLDELHDRLSGFQARLQGAGETDRNNPASTSPVGLSSELSAAEGRLRDCLALIGGLHDAF